MARENADSGTALQQKTKSVLHDPKEIARAELVRFRRLLGTLTREQELGIENLLMSTATTVSILARRKMETLVASSGTSLDFVPNESVQPKFSL